MATKFEKLIKELKNIKGRHTELVTVYVPAGYDLNQIAAQLRNEAGTAENIKSKSTRKNVVAALEKCVQHLKVYKHTPENGLVLFCGNVSEHEGSNDIELWAVEPPQELRNKLYWCDQKFVTDPLEEMTKSKESYGMILLDGSEATIGYVRGKKVIPVKHMESVVPGKTRAGGQSAARFGRVREALLNDWKKEVAESAHQIFGEDIKNIKGIILGGPGPVKEEFLKEEHLHYQLQEKVIGTVATSYTGEHGLHELVERSSDILAEAEITKEKEIMQRFFEELKKDTGLATYGIHQVEKALELGAVETILVSEDSEWKEIEVLCPSGHGEKRVEKESKFNELKCNQCDKETEVMGEKDIDEYFEEKAENFGSKVVLISKDTREGEQLYQMGGIAAILRFRI